MKTAAAYIRVSDERQDEFSPDSQLKLIREYCKRNEIDLPDELVFYDDGISAKSTKKRKQFNEMIALAKQKEKPFEAILVWKFSRFARNQEESIVYKSLLRKNGVEVISISEPVQDNPFGGLIERIIEWMDEYYLIRLSDEVRRGMTERATRGKPNTAPPFGYKMVNGEYEIEEKEAELVREIYNTFETTEKIKPIADNLRVREIKNRRGNYMDNRMIEYILRNPCYIGCLRWNPNGRSASKRNFDNPEDIITRGTHAPLITDEQYARVQEIFEKRKKAYGRYARKESGPVPYMLKGLVKCDACGSTLVYNKQTKGVQCHKYAHGTCGVSHFIKTDELDKLVIAEMKKAVETLDLNVEYREKKEEGTVGYNKAQLTREKLKLERAKQAYQNGVDSLEEYRENKQKILERIAQLSEAPKKKITKADIKESIKAISAVLRLVENGSVSEDLKNEAMRGIVSKVILYKPEKRVEVFYYS